MSTISSRRYGVQQPCRPPAIDWSHPLAKGLVYSAYNSAADAGMLPVNYAAGETVGTKSGTSAIASSPNGFAGISTKFNGSSDVAAQTVDLSPYRQVTISWHMYWDAFANNDKLAMEYTAAWNTHNGFLIDPNESGSGQFVAGISNGSNIGIRSCTRPTAAVWRHYSVQFDRNLTGFAAVVQIAFDFVIQTLTNSTNTFAASSFDNSTLNIMCRNSASLFGAGRIMNLNIHNYLLPLDYIKQLALTPFDMFKPLKRRAMMNGYTPTVASTDTTRFFLAA